MYFIILGTYHFVFKYGIKNNPYLGCLTYPHKITKNGNGGGNLGSLSGGQKWDTFIPLVNLTSSLVKSWIMVVKP